MRCRRDCQPLFAGELSSRNPCQSQRLPNRAHPGLFPTCNLPASYKLFTPLFIPRRENEHHTPEINSLEDVPGMRAVNPKFPFDSTESSSTAPAFLMEEKYFAE